jgi:hypothetical protein
VAKLFNGHKKQIYIINEKMRAELDFIRQALNDDSGISFEVPSISFIIPKTPTASLFGDSSLLSCGGYSTDLRVWRYLPLLDKIVQRTLLHLKNNEDETFISINCLEYVTKIINYCASLTAFLESKITDDPHPVVLCFTDNISAKNKKLMITFRIQKNQQNGRSITFVADVKHPHICPVRSA